MTMPDLVVIVPSRGRPARAAEVAEQCDRTCTADTWLIVAVDEDDPTLPDYDKALSGWPRAIVHAVARPAGHVGAINAGAAEALRWKDAPFAIAKLDDDHRPRSPKGWDAAMLAALREMGTGIVYGNDLLQGQRLPTAPAITADIVQALGYMGPPELNHLYVDDFWRDLGTGAGCLRYLPNVIIEHLHPLAGKSPIDQGYIRANDPAQYRRDSAAYEAYKAERFAADIAKVQALRSIRT